MEKEMDNMKKTTDWRDVIKTVAPALGSALGGPLGGLATRAISDVLLGEGASSKPEEDIKNILLGKSGLGVESLEKLRAAEERFKVQLKRLDVDLERIHAKDRDSARDRQERTGDRWPNYMGLLVVLGFFATLAYVLIYGLGQLDAATAAFSGTLVGYVSAKADQVIAYFFGSSTGSREKTRALAKAVRPRNV